MRIAIVGLAALVAVVVTTGCGSEDLNEITYSPEFTTLVTEGMVTSVEIIQEPSGDTYLRGESTGGQHPGSFKVNLAEGDDVIRMLIDYGVEFSARHNSGAWQEMSSLLPVVFLGVLWLVWGVVIIVLLWLAMRLVRAVEQIAKNTEKE